jgi:hypothetical protein
MDINQLKFYLERGNSFGLNVKNEHDGCLAWILVSKREAIGRFFELFEEEDAPEVYQAQIDIKERPYQVWFAELKREVYDNDKMPSDTDYKINNAFFFNDLEEVAGFLNDRSVALDDLKWSSEVSFL